MNYLNNLNDFDDENNFNKSKKKKDEIHTAIDSVLKGVFLVLLALYGNYIAETLGCKTQKILLENIYLKHLLIFMLIFFATDFTYPGIDLSPISTFKYALIIYIIILMCSRMNMNFTITTFGIATLIYITIIYIDYYNTKPNNELIIKKLEYIKKFLTVIGLVIIVTGVLLYYKEKKKEYKEIWSLITFIFGKTKCKSIK